ncbi:hypothetical protein H257_05467 [Aphanomyces astaci]|uniref:CCHC-type domain-containing protein n=1 Tax=Aphanomyces astaci TaxID=112090 RepID=W4GSQ8_APHAT|nr:hypothetical protein H257_05467 [Aphanomyces astaci]ETV81928.1 hypothetical protein H257_05467 [Aphanomyces astaci]|eukprot:XP_009828665.1 hypothetical protein H257_05467 [Aphanomyces astaci]
MKLLRMRDVRPDEIIAKSQVYAKPRSNSSASTSSRTTTSELSTPPASPCLSRCGSHIEVEDQAAIATTSRTHEDEPGSAQLCCPIQPSQSYGFAYPQAPPIQPSTSSYGQRYQQPYAPNTIAPPGQATLPPNLTSTQNQMFGAGRARVGHIPVVISSKPDEMTVSGQNIVIVVVMTGHYPGEQVKLCHFCGQPGHTVTKCPSKPTNQA